MTVDKVIAKIIWLTFFGPPCTHGATERCNDHCNGWGSQLLRRSHRV